MDFRYQLRYRFPAEVKCDLCSNIQIDSGNKKVSSGANHSPNIPQTFFGIAWDHVAEKIIRHYHVLRPQITNELRIGGITYPHHAPHAPLARSCRSTFGSSKGTLKGLEFAW